MVSAHVTKEEDFMSEKNEELFRGLVMMLAMQAMQCMGKIMNPVTNKIERHMDGARQAIDLLDMLAAKTKGNLSDDEDKLLKHILGDLKLNYVEEANPGKKDDEPAAPAAEDKPADGAAQ